MAQRAAEVVGGPGAVEKIGARDEGKPGGEGEQDGFFEEGVEAAVAIHGFDGLAGLRGEGLFGEIAVLGPGAASKERSLGTGFGNEQRRVAMNGPDDLCGMARGEGRDVFDGILGRGGEAREAAFAQFGDGSGVEGIERPVGGEVEIVGARDEVERGEVRGLPAAVARVEEMADLRG